MVWPHRYTEQLMRYSPYKGSYSEMDEVTASQFLSTSNFLIHTLLTVCVFDISREKRSFVFLALLPKTHTYESTTYVWTMSVGSLISSVTVNGSGKVCSGWSLIFVLLKASCLDCWPEYNVNYCTLCIFLT